MVAARLALCAVLLGGCLIVRATDDPVETPCPNTHPELLADAFGPFVITDALYFIGRNGTLSKLALDGGPVSELTVEPVYGLVMTADAANVYVTHPDEIVSRPLAGGPPLTIATGYTMVSELLVDDTSVVWASQTGLDRWSKLDQTIEHLDDGNLILGLGASDGVYYYSQTHGDAVRRAPPVQDLATAQYPGPLVVDEGGVYYYEVGDSFVDYAGVIRVVPREGGSVVTLLSNLLPVVALAADDTDLYFATAYSVEYRIKRVSRFGGETHTLTCGEYEHQRIWLAVAGDFVYWTNGSALYRIDKHAAD